jgi:hypothetical protein
MLTRHRHEISKEFKIDKLEQQRQHSKVFRRRWLLDLLHWPVLLNYKEKLPYQLQLYLWHQHLRLKYRREES